MRIKTTTTLVLVGIVCCLILNGTAWYMILRFISSTESAGCRTCRTEVLTRATYVAATGGGLGVVILIVCLAWAFVLWRKRQGVKSQGGAGQ